MFIDYSLSQDDLMAELEELEQEELDEKLLDVGPISDNLPSVPATEPKAAKKGKHVILRLYSTGYSLFPKNKIVVLKMCRVLEGDMGEVVSLR